MGGFFLIPRRLENLAYEKTIFQIFIERGFRSFVSLDCKEHKITYFSKIGATKKQVWKDNNENFLIITGTAWYKMYSLEEAGKFLLEDFVQNTVSKSSLKGTFCIIYYNAKTGEIKFLHDSNGVFRFYIDNKTSAISSSWYALAGTASDVNLDRDAIVFNILTGFNPGKKTWLMNIERILSEKQAPPGIGYDRAIKNNREEKLKFNSADEAVAVCNELLSQNLIEAVKQSLAKTVMGLSSGFDSRLIAAVLSNYFTKELEFFTFYKPGSKDPIIARAIADILDARLLQKESSRAALPGEQSEVFEKAFCFFDGQCVTMSQYSKLDYTFDFREQMLGEDILHLSGVGGELFRNYNHDHQRTIKIRSWGEAFILGGYRIEHYVPEDLSQIFLRDLKHYLCDELGIKKELSFSDRKRFYGSLFLRDWHGVRNSAENQYSFYYSPFTDPDLIDLSYATAPFQGYGGMFEIKMINALSPMLAHLDSEYGYPLDSYSSSRSMRDFVSAYIKLFPFNRLRNFNRKKERFKLTEWEERLLTIFNLLEIHINVEAFLYSSVRAEPLLSTAYVLNKLFRTDAA